MVINHDSSLYMGITFLCACGFLLSNISNTPPKFSHGIYREQAHFFLVFYFTMTYFHAMHVIGGMIPIGWMLAKSFTKRGYRDWERVEILGLYWHFVDLVDFPLFRFFISFSDNYHEFTTTETLILRGELWALVYRQKKCKKLSENLLVH